MNFQPMARKQKSFRHSCFALIWTFRSHCGLYGGKNVHGSIQAQTQFKPLSQHLSFQMNSEHPRIHSRPPNENFGSFGPEIDRAIIYQNLAASKSQSLVTAAQQAVELHGKLRANAMRQHVAPRAKKHDNHGCSNTEKISCEIHSKRGVKNEKNMMLLHYVSVSCLLALIDPV